ncbi:transglycosylase family protein, partial [Streptomyces sp. NPDC059456]|uniref:transglycosylase family protein n=1 Tax=Streptomyces sp. NPDC059456 TaxID=3346838 RepID=UPI0036943A46
MSKSRLGITVSLVAAVGCSTVVAMSGAANAASVSTWDKVANCESSGNWSINTGNGFYGGLQFTDSTWRGYGGTQYAPRADLATKQQQILIGEKVLASQGQGAWPSCGPAAGLGADHADPYPDPATTPDPVKNTVHLQRIAPGGALLQAEGDFSTGKWSAWADQGASELKEVTSAGTGSVNRVFAIGGDDRVYENDGDYATGKWSGWFQLKDAPQAKAISASSDGNTVHLVVVGADGQLYNADGDYSAGKWNGWTGHGGTGLKRVTSATTADHVNHIFATNANDQILELDADYAAGKWADWSVAGPAGGFNAIDVTASVAGNVVHLGAIGQDGNWYNTDGDFAGGSWNGWWNGG